MNLLFQCMGITGVILALYGLLSFAVTQVSTWFFWTLLGGGGALCLVFVLTSLPRKWQAAVGSLVALNLPWIFLALGRDWLLWKLAVVGGLCMLGLFWFLFRRIRTDALIAILVIVLAWTITLAGFHEKAWYNWGVLAAAFVYNGAFLYVARALLADLIRSRSLQYGSSAAVYTLITLAILVVLNVLSTDRHYQWDLTEEKVNQLTDQTVKILKSLKEPLKITVFLDSRNEAKPGVKDLLGAYRNESKNVEVRFADPDREKEFATQHKVKDGDLLVDYRGQTNVTQQLNEEGVTQAIDKVTHTKRTTVCFTKGHGELDLDAPDEEADSLSAARAGLTNEGYQPKAVASILPDVPADCSAVVVAGPAAAFTKGEADALDRYPGNGGNVLALLDPKIQNPALNPKTFTIVPTGLEDVLKKWGVELGRDFILEKHVQLFAGVQTGPMVLGQDYGNHPVVDPLKGKNTVFQPVRSVRKVKGFTGTEVELISSAGDGKSWAETDIDSLVRRKSAKEGAADLKGPVPFALAVEKERPKTAEGAAPAPTRLVVIGNASFVSNGTVRSYEFNFDLFLNSLNWLQGEVERISIRPKKLRSSAIELTPQQSNVLFYVAIICLPMLVLIFGMDLWWWRRRRG
ncbi:MAG: GldG family protein [Pseudomonadota bacterium]